MNRDKYLATVRERMPEPRYVHTLGVMETAIHLADHYGVSKVDAEVAAILHDIAKFSNPLWMKKIIQNEKMNPILLEYHHELWHAPVGAYVVRNELGITNENILNAIRFHTTGRANMSPLEKILYVADMIEPNRRFPNVDLLREHATEGLDGIMEACIIHSIKFLIQKKQPVFPDSIHCYNDLVNKKGKVSE
ncbi:MAG: bis(5'-nucleosyl)-tetraphosphatase (symmetrical) YqeK [Paenisporosarcina sp.]